jgi:hypothetical protein
MPIQLPRTIVASATALHSDKHNETEAGFRGSNVMERPPASSGAWRVNARTILHNPFQAIFTHS